LTTLKYQHGPIYPSLANVALHRVADVALPRVTDMTPRGKITEGVNWTILIIEGVEYTIFQFEKG
jgi:hypothetical protein